MSIQIKNNKDISIIKVQPYNQQIINIIKEFKDRKYCNETKEFTVPNTEMDALKARLEQSGFSWTESENDKDENKLNDIILLNYNNNMFQILNMPICNKKLYFMVKDHLIKLGQNVYLPEKFFVYFLELCNKNKILLKFE
jgi:hypothetical protein